MKLQLFIALIFSAVASMATPVIAQETSNPESPKTTDEKGGVIIWVLSTDCAGKTPELGPGSKDEPIKVDFYSLGSNRNLHCKWVRSEGLLTSAYYYDYQAKFNEDLTTLYFENRYASAQPSLWVENFTDPNFDVFKNARSDVEFVGLYGMLCGDDEDHDDDFAENVIMVLGPCHYGPAGVLKDVSIKNILTPAYRYIYGEQNRSLIGDIKIAPTNWPEREKAFAAVRQWLKEVSKGQTAYRSFLFGDVAALDEETREYALSKSEWHNKITSAESPLVKNKKARREIEIFYEEWYTGADDVDAARDDTIGLENIIACVCLTNDCNGRWPIMEKDTHRMWGAFTCAPFEKKSDGNWGFVN